MTFEMILGSKGLLAFDCPRSIGELEELHFWLSHRNKAERENKPQIWQIAKEDRIPVTPIFATLEESRPGQTETFP